MTSDRKQPGVAFWATVVVVAVLVGYLLSAGPATWLFLHVLPKGSLPALNFLYAPVAWAGSRSQRINDAVEWYVSLWVDTDELVKKALGP